VCHGTSKELFLGRQKSAGVITIKNNIISIIRTFPESFSPGNFSIPNNFVITKSAGVIITIIVNNTINVENSGTL